MVAAAIVGGAVIGGVASNAAAKKGSSASKRGAETAAGAELESTRLQVEEIRRQFDYQQSVLLPQIQRQYQAQGAYSDLLGIAPPPDMNASGSNASLPNLRETAPGSGAYRPGGGGTGNVLGGSLQLGPYEASLEQQYQPPTQQGTSTPAIPRSTPTEFLDRNLDPTSLAESAGLGDQIRDNLMAGTSADDDPYRNYISGNQVAAGSMEDDLRFRHAKDVTLASGAAGTGVYGEEFESSPGYDFQVEEMGRELDRRNSAGGNFGGRAIMEAQRRAQGLAAGDFYNWAAGRTSDLQRKAGAEATDIGRADSAVAGYDQQRIADVQRGDHAMQDYMRRQEGDAARLDAATSEEDRLRAADLARKDQGYYNYLANLSRQAGMGDAAGQAVNASQGTAAGVSNAYGNQGNTLASIYSNEGRNQAQIAYNRGANINNSVQQGLSNWITYQNAQ